jgi:hypothetical protein
MRTTLRLAPLAYIVIVLVAGSVSPGLAFTLDFEGIADHHMHNYTEGVNQSLGNYYGSAWGVHLGPTVYVLDQSYRGGGFDASRFPPHSGSAVIYSHPNTYFDMTLDAPASSVSLWYSAEGTVGLDAFDSEGALLTSAQGGSSMGASAQLTVSDADGRISSVRLFDDGNYFTADDICVVPAAPAPPLDETPEPCTLILLGASGVLIGAVRRRRSA